MFSRPRPGAWPGVAFLSLCVSACAGSSDINTPVGTGGNQLGTGGDGSGGNTGGSSSGVAGTSGIAGTTGTART